MEQKQLKLSEESSYRVLPQPWVPYSLSKRDKGRHFNLSELSPKEKGAAFLH